MYERYEYLLVDARDMLHFGVLSPDDEDGLEGLVGLEDAALCGQPVEGMRHIEAISGFYIAAYCLKCHRLHRIAKIADRLVGIDDD